MKLIIRIEERDVSPFRFSNPMIPSSVRTLIFLPDIPNPGISEFLNHFTRTILRPVVNDDQFKVCKCLSDYTADCSGKYIRSVICGDYHAD